MIPEPQNKSLVQILLARPDTVFDGDVIDEKTAEQLRKNNHNSIYRDENGDYYQHPHDYIATEEVDGELVGIIVGDKDGRNCMDHPHSHLPHPLGLYVREDYRSRGIGSKLLERYMDSVSGNKCVIDCEPDLVPYYEQFDYDIIYLQSYKIGLEPTTVPLPPDADQLDIDTSDSPKHEVRFIEAGGPKNHMNDENASIIIAQHHQVGQMCSIEIQMPYKKYADGTSTPYRFTDETISEVNSIVDEVLGEQIGNPVSDADFTTIPSLNPEDARALADRLYPIVTDKSNLTLSKHN